MKKYNLYLLSLGVGFMTCFSFSSCKEENTINANDVLEIKSVLPSKVIPGQPVTITGTGLGKATSVVFPGDIRVSELNKVGDNYLTVITPSGISQTGGNIRVETGEQTAGSSTLLTVGNPSPLRVAPLDSEIKINSCLEVYGNDLEFITKAYFPGKDGDEIIVEADRFKRKSTSALYIYTPLGIQPGTAVVSLEDCSGKRYALPEVILSDKISDGSSGGDGEGYQIVWEGEFEDIEWADWLYLTTDQLNMEGISPREGQMVRLNFSTTGGSICIYDGWWNDWVSYDLAAGDTEIEFPLTEGMANTLNSGDGLIIGGGDFILYSVEFYREYPTIWSGEMYTGWWWYLPSAELNLSAITPEAGQTIRFVFLHHDEQQQFCVCDGWWGAPYIRDGGESENNVWIAPGEDFIDFEVSEGMATTMNNVDETALIIGGDVTVTKIQIKTF